MMDLGLRFSSGDAGKLPNEAQVAPGTFFPNNMQVGICFVMYLLLSFHISKMSFKHESRHEKTYLRAFVPAVQSQKMARGLKFWI